MSTDFERFLTGKTAIGSAIQGCEEPPNPVDATLTIRVYVFFDGTFNNRRNVTEGKKGNEKDCSYRNEYTNIEVLERCWENNSSYTHSFSVYIEGVGTTDLKDDDYLSAATGCYSTGIASKVEKGMKQVVKKIRSRVKNTRNITLVHVDTFGFSRGAAAARNFVHTVLYQQRMSLKAQLAIRGYMVGMVKVLFVGLFDTVAAYGLSHTNNTRELHLDAVKSAEKVVHLAAADEFRKNFRLTNIASAPHGLEMFLPGAHSDVGGGYVHDDDEVEWQLSNFKTINKEEKAAIERDKKWLVECGWFVDEEFRRGLERDLSATRRGISNQYSRIPLKMMADHARSCGINFKPCLATDYVVPKQLKELEQLILKYQPSSPDFWSGVKGGFMRELRHRFFHFSAHYGTALGANDPQFSNDDPINGRRQRVIQNG